jgi:murein DD-endopeptidase MepM/ murein hydrolase activator NlpD
MSPVRSRGFAAIALALLLVALILPSAGSREAHAGSPNVNDAIAEQEKMEAALARGRAELANLARQEAELTATIADLNGSLQEVGLQIEAKAKELQDLTFQLEKARAELVGYQQQIATLESDLKAVEAGIEQSKADLVVRQQLLQDHLRVAYEQSQTSLLEVLLSSDSLGDATNQLGFMLTLSDQDAQLADEIQQAKTRLEIKQQTLRDGRQTLSELRDSTKQRAEALDRQQAALAEAKRQLDEQRAKLAKLLADREAALEKNQQRADEEAATIAEQEHALEGQRALVERLKEEARKLGIAYRGRFAWPEKGNFMVTQEFGHTSFDAHHTGIDMAYVSPHCGGPIYAAASGVVLADGRPNAAYGDSAIGVIVGHSQTLQTWYWHMSREIVHVGQQVNAGDLIGYEGATGWATGCHLHFQVMSNGSPVNPRAYLP